MGSKETKDRQETRGLKGLRVLKEPQEPPELKVYKERLVQLGPREAPGL